VLCQSLETFHQKLFMKNQHENNLGTLSYQQAAGVRSFALQHFRIQSRVSLLLALLPGWPPPSQWLGDWFSGACDLISCSRGQQSCQGPSRAESLPGEEASEGPGSSQTLGLGPWALGLCSGACNAKNKASVQAVGPFSCGALADPVGLEDSWPRLPKQGLSCFSCGLCFLSGSLGHRGVRSGGAQAA
jgi:hypothetical protein